MTPEEIANVLRLREGPASEYEDGNDVDQQASELDSVARRTEELGPVLRTCRELLAALDESRLEAVAEKLGDGSRQVTWRLPYGNSGILAFFVEQLGRQDISNGLKVQSLRIIGNACADTDYNRGLLVVGDGLEAVIRQLADESVVQFTVPVLYNVMVDYGTADPAQSLASELQISRSVIKLLSSPNLPQFMNVLLYFARILALIVSKDTEHAIADDKTVSTLLFVAINTPCKDDAENFASVASVAVAYLAAERFQSLIITNDEIGLFLDVFHHAHVGFDPAQIGIDPDLAAALKQLRLSLLGMLAQLSGRDDFQDTYPLTSAPARTLLSWLKSGVGPLQSAACIALGNLSRSDGASTALVQQQEDAPQAILLSLIGDPAVTDAQLLHAALSFLKNLAIPAQNKLILRPLLEPSCVPRIYALDTFPQVQYAAASLTRLLLSSCPSNISLFCGNRVDEGTVTADPDGAERKSSSSNKNSVDGLITLFGRTDSEPTKVEAARSIAAICRALHSEAAAAPAEQLPGINGYDIPDNCESRRAAFYARHHSGVGDLLAFLVTQDKWPALRSDAWFVLALMSRSVDGSRVVATVVQRDGVASRLTEAVLGRKQQTGERVTEVEEEEEGEAAVTADGGPSQNGDEATALATAAEGLRLQQPPLRTDGDDEVDAAARHKARIAAAERENALVMCTELLKSQNCDLVPSSRALLQRLLKEGTELVVAFRSRESAIQKDAQAL